jgi:hypothetical protein
MYLLLVCSNFAIEVEEHIPGIMITFRSGIGFLELGRHSKSVEKHRK